jgi:Fe2+ or Zn2+ uptake regulation protein
MKEAEPTGSKYKVMFVQCSSCGAVVGVVDYYNIPGLLEKIAAKLGFKLLS